MSPPDSGGAGRPASRRGKLALAVVAAAVVVTVAAGLGVSGARDEAVRAAATGGLCASCHAEPSSHWTHGDASCDSCHSTDEPLAFALWQADLGLRDPPAHSGVDATTCGGCHGAAGGPLESEGHDVHVRGGELACASCHGGVHDDVDPTACESCHAEVERHGATADTSCTTCHAFGSTSAVALGAVDPAAAGLPSDAMGWSRLHGAMDCRRCHDPHREEPLEVRCETCHRGHLEAEQAAGPEGHRDCVGCHAPHAPREQPAVDCLGCHTYPSAGSGWETILSASAPAPMAVPVTHEGRCGTCHEPHTWVASEGRCGQCHADQARSLAALPSESHGGCTTCHEAHEPPPEGSVCAGCHTEVHAAAGVPGRHRDCLSCHDAHGGRPDPTETCTSCHAAVHAQTLTTAPAHQRCASCHAAHGAPLRPTPSACGTCHSDPAVALAAARPGLPAAHRCSSCHQPHRFVAGGAALSRCAACHTETIAAHSSHRGACTTCHEAHAAPLGGVTDCAACHADVHPSVAGHTAGRGCHEPHEMGARALGQCADCHGPLTRTARTWPAGTAHSGRCADCHEAHREDRFRSCESCHARQANRAHTGGHPSCVQCHAPHERRPAAGQGWWSRCSSCHADEARAVEQANGTHARCSSCHQPPGPPLPSCASCHEGASRQLAHRSHASEPCASCHATHGVREVARTDCLGCHEDQRGHFPDARQCQSCHPFGH